jgi:PleD family two-component response regulator
MAPLLPRARVRMTAPERLSRPPRILIVSDQDGTLWQLETFLGRRGYSVVREFAGRAAVARAQTVLPDVILLDARLADPAVLELSASLRDDTLVGASTPLLLMAAGRPSRKDRMAALRAGVWQLVSQRPNTSELLRTLDECVRAKLEATRAPSQSVVDETTGLYSTHGLVRRARELIFQAARHNTAVTCLVCAPEPMAEQEATAAAASAELVPRMVTVLQTAARRSDAIGRTGSAELAVVAPGANGAGAVKLAGRLRRAGTGAGFALRAGYDSVANLRYTPLDPTELLARAARALHLARAEGKWVRESLPGA